MEALVLFLCITSKFYCVVDGRFHYHRHGHHHQLANQSIALPPESEPPSESPEPIRNSSNSTYMSPPPSPTSTNSSYIPLPLPPPSPNSSNSTYITPLPSPPSSANSSNSTYITPLPAPPSSPSSSNSTTITPLPSPPKSTNSTYNSSIIPPAPAPSPTNALPNGPYPSIEVFNVRSFGAVGDGESDDTEAFKSAWDSACQAGPAVLLAPRGYKFMIRSTIFTGPCQSPIIFHVGGTVMSPDGPDAWPANNSRRQWLLFYRADGLTMQGGGLIDGRGEKWWNLPCKPHKGINGTTLPGPCDSPVALRFFMSSNLSVHGLKIQNSPQFHFRFDNCQNVTIDNISINSPALSPNTDGIHVENTRNVGIYNSVISNGDDCVSIGAGSLNVDIRNVTCGPGHGISIGSLGKQNSRACVSNITVQNAIIKHSDNGVRIKTWQGGSGSVSSITFKNIRMDTVRNPIMIDQYYCLSKSCANQTSNIFISDISYSGIKGTYDVRSPPIHLGCSDSVPCTNVTLTDVELLPAVGNEIANPFCWNVYGEMDTLTIPPVACLLEGLPRSIMEYDAEMCY